jgi:arylsulfatase A-like enzyme
MMGYQTPNIDRIAREGVGFTDYYAQQSCTAGRAAFIGGSVPVRSGMTKVGVPGAKEGWKAVDVTMATVLKGQGYATGQFGKNHQGAKDTETVVTALIKNARKLPQELYKSLTWDRGKEMADHKRFTLATDIQVYFCDPKSPWQRGSNENTNGLLRQYLPKGIDISSYSQAKLNAMARQLNQRPRKTLGYQTPAVMFSQTVASTG